MTDHSEARVEAAAQAWMPREDQWPSVRPIMRKALAAADEVDRAAGVIRVDINDDGMAALVAAVLLDVVYGWNLAHEVPSNEAHESSMLAARAVLSQFAALAAAGAQPPPEEETQQ